MNCKPGDLAVLVRSWAGNEGRIVRCIRLATEQEVDTLNLWAFPNPWILDISLRSINGTMVAMAYDQHLRPIRDPGDDAQDETLTWFPVPQKEHA